MSIGFKRLGGGAMFGEWIDKAGQERMEDGYGQESSSGRRHLQVSVKSQKVHCLIQTAADSKVYLICIRSDRIGLDPVRDPRFSIGFAH